MSDFNTGLARTIVPQKMPHVRISIDDFLTAYNAGEAELVDVRLPLETKVWSVNFGLKLPPNELPERLSEPPRDKLLVVACPMTDRSNMARTYLASQGFEVKCLQDGLLGLMNRLNGGAARDVELEKE